MIPRIPTEIINMMASVPRERQILTTDGLIYDNTHYRFNPQKTSRALSANSHKTPHKFRLKGTAKAFVRIRCWEGNIDRIEVIDDETGKGFSMWSTNPQYTGGLSRWEHHQYHEMMRKRLGPGQINLSQNDVEREIMATKAEFLSDFDNLRPKISLRKSETATALVECEEHRQAQLADAENKSKSQRNHAGPANPIVPAITRESVRIPAGANREDEPCPPKQTRGSKNKEPWPEAPPRTEDFGVCSTAKLTRPSYVFLAPEEETSSYERVEISGAKTKPGASNLWPEDQ